jgi:hypothetical protein
MLAPSARPGEKNFNLCSLKEIINREISLAEKFIFWHNRLEHLDTTRNYILA